MSIVRFAALFLMLGVTACSQLEPVETPAAFSPIVPNGQITKGRCHMGGCSWVKWVDVEKLSSSDTELELRATLLSGGSEHQPGAGSTEDPQYPTSPEGVAIGWDAQPRTERILCSYRAPSVANEVLPLNQETGVYGSQESAAEVYFAACHSYFAGYVSGIREFGYDVKGQD